MSREIVFYFVGITSQIFIIGIGLFMLKSYLAKKNNPDNQMQLFKEYFESKFNFLYEIIRELKKDIDEIKKRL